MGGKYSLDELAALIGAGPPPTERTFEAVSTDTRTLSPGAVFFALNGETFDGNRFVPEAFAKGAAAAVTTQAHPDGPCLVVAEPLTALQRFAAHHRQHYEGPLLAITGSCGKTGTKEFVAALLGSCYKVAKTEGNLNNEIGTPLSLLALDADTEFGVFELGANHRGEIARMCAWAKPTESAITLIAPAHLEGFGDIEAVAAAKAEIMEGLPKDGTFYVNGDDPRCVAIGERHPGETIRFGREGDVALEDCYFDSAGEMVLRVRPVGTLRLPLLCRAHAHNVLLAIAVGLRHGVAEFEAPLREAARRTLRFKPVRIGPFEILDDTYNSNPASAAAALQALADRPGEGARIAALGDMLELGTEAARLHRELGAQARACGVTHLFARGDFASDVVEGAAPDGELRAEIIQDHQALADAIVRAAPEGGSILLKGSRGMRMENVIEALRGHLGHHVE
ncbi:MAG: UDP-N-acetylmuramoyl-tripeptide--D-alanyl-D-alanine ligase [Candidatus Hydrogenedentota bacterium]